MSRWPADFPYHIEVGIGSVLAAGAVAVVIAMLTVGYQSLKAALANPVEALRYD